jgi:hypothetical protein
VAFGGEEGLDDEPPLIGGSQPLLQHVCVEQSVEVVEVARGMARSCGRPLDAGARARKLRGRAPLGPVGREGLAGKRLPRGTCVFCYQGCPSLRDAAPVRDAPFRIWVTRFIFEMLPLCFLCQGPSIPEEFRGVGGRSFMAPMLQRGLEPAASRSPSPPKRFSTPLCFFALRAAVSPSYASGALDAKPLGLPRE